MTLLKRRICLRLANLSTLFFKPKKDVKALGFVNLKELTHHHMPMLQFDFFFLKDLNWYYKPQNYIIKNFVEKDYDILINLCDSACIPIKVFENPKQNSRLVSMKKTSICMI